MTWADVPRAVGASCGITLILLLACATRGDRFNADAVPKIIPGVTSQMEVQEWFGKPNSVRVWGSGGSEWRYVYEAEQRRDTRTITKIGRSLASIFGHRTYFPPLDVAYTKTTRDSMAVQFDAEGTVVDYNYERQEFPTRRVY